jgi:Mor family transcriptional regulator
MASPGVEATEAKADAMTDEDVVALAKRHRISPAIVREIMRRAGTSDRPQVEREIAKGKARR